MIPSGIKIQNAVYTTKWLLTRVASGIDLNRMSTASRRDFPLGVSGSQMTLAPETCFLEVPFPEPPPFSYLLTFECPIREADMRGAGDAGFSGQYYDPDHGYSQQVFIENSGEFAASGCDCLHRYSAAVKLKAGKLADVLSFFPSARSKIILKEIEPLGTGSPPIQVTLWQGEVRSSEEFYRKA
jgi:hypothetical protein